MKTLRAEMNAGHTIGIRVWLLRCQAWMMRETEGVDNRPDNFGHRSNPGLPIMAGRDRTGQPLPGGLVFPCSRHLYIFLQATRSQPGPRIAELPASTKDPFAIFAELEMDGAWGFHGIT